MGRNLKEKIVKYLNKQRQRKIGYGLLASLGAVVVFCTTYALILPAITMSNDPICGYEAHTHTESCWSLVTQDPEPELVCTDWMEADVVYHTHDQLCYDPAGQLVCPLQERALHRHDETCFIEEKELICGLEGIDEDLAAQLPESVITPSRPEQEPEDSAPAEPVHVHSEDCYTRVQGALICGLEESEGHFHSPDCYELRPIEGAFKLVCGLEEEPFVEAPVLEDDFTDLTGFNDLTGYGGGHVHTDACYEPEMENALVCVEAEGQGHVHTDECYEWTEELACGQDGIDEATAQALEFLARQQEEQQPQEPEEPEEPLHIHTAECYLVNLTQVCQEEAELHTHGPECYETRETFDELGNVTGTEEVLICALPMAVEHQHTQDCVHYKVNQELSEAMELTCGMEVHVHTDACYIEREPEADPWFCGFTAHAHNEECYFESGELRCTMPEHEHTEACLDPNSAPEPDYPLDVNPGGEKLEYVCGVEEHTHDLEKCYVNGFLTCETVEHVHGAACLPEKEPQPDLICGLEEHVHGEDCYNEDGELACELEEHTHGEDCYAPVEEPPVLVLVCEKPAHEHSVDCYDAGGNLTCGVEQHIHGEECYAPLEEQQPEEPDAEWKCGKAEHVHEGGCYGEDGVLVCEEEEHIHSDACLTEGEESFQLTAEAEGSEGVRVIVSGSTGILPCDPADVTLTAKQLSKDDPTAEKAESLIKAAVEGENEGAEEEDRASVKETILFEISLWCNGEEIEPTGTLRLAFANLPGEQAEGEDLEVYHVDTVTEETTGMGAAVDEEGNLALDTDHFSVYAVTRVGRTDLANELKKNGDKTITLTEDVTLSSGVEIGSGETILDLNGFTLTLAHQDNPTIFVPSDAKLTVTDGKKSNIAVTEDGPHNVTYEHAGEIATYDAGSNTLTYYVTTATPTGEIGRTQETRTKYTVNFTNAGRVRCTGANTFAAIQILGGEMHFDSGLMVGGPKGRCIDVHGGKLYLEGGYITGADSEKKYLYDGESAAVLVEDNIYEKVDGEAVLSGTVIAGNSRGFHIKENAVFTMTGGVISGNGIAADYITRADGVKVDINGSGIFAVGSTVNLTGGYLTNNTGRAGSGLYVRSAVGTVELGGTLQVTSNNGKYSGGAICLLASNCTINSGSCFISANRAEYGEGGAMRIEESSSCILRAGYVTNNATKTSEHWGGGGIFCADGGNRLLVLDALITGNRAGGFGGGVAGCSTGRLMVSAKEGAAIYDNKAIEHGGNNPHLSGTTSTKNADHTAWETDPVFKNNGFDDYFCALSSVVDGGMLGGGSANWSGSADGVAYQNVGKGQTLEASRLMGLTAHPDDGAKASAKNQAKAFITGNYSYTHGGGILTNGYLIIGDTKEFEIPKSVAFKMKKEVLTNNGTEIPTPKQYTFEVTDITGKVLQTVQNETQPADENNDEKSVIKFSFEYGKADLTGVPEGGSKEFTYFVKEKPNNADSSVVYDTTVYKIVVTATWKQDGEITFNGEDYSSIKLNRYYPTHVKVYKNNEVNPIFDQAVGYSEAAYQTVDLTETDVKFVNSKKIGEKTAVSVTKVWSDGNENKDSVQVQLLQNGQSMGNNYKVTLNAANNWSHIWTDLPVNKDGTFYTYSVQEVTVPGYQSTYETKSAFTDGGYVPVSNTDSLVVGGRYIIVSPNGDKALYVPKDRENLSPGNEATDRFGTGDVSSVTQQGTPEGNGYQTWYKAANINEKSIFTVGIDGSSQKTYLQMTATENPQREPCYLALEHYYNSDGNNVRFKTTNGTAFTDSFWLENGDLRSTPNGDPIQGNWRIEFENGKFLSSNGSSYRDGQAAKVYKYVNSYTMITITNTPDGEVPYSMELTKTDETGARKLGGAEFKLLKTNEDGTLGEPLKFTSNNSGSYQVAAEGANGTTDVIVTNQGGTLYVAGIPEGTYTLRETKAPLGYATAEDQTLTFNANNDKITDRVLGVTVQDAPFQLPKTGGANALIYPTGGGLLAAAGILVYSKKTKRKGGADRT